MCGGIRQEVLWHCRKCCGTHRRIWVLIAILNGVFSAPLVGFQFTRFLVRPGAQRGHAHAAASADATTRRWSLSHDPGAGCWRGHRYSPRAGVARAAEPRRSGHCVAATASAHCQGGAAAGAAVLGTLPHSWGQGAPAWGTDRRRCTRASACCGGHGCAAGDPGADRCVLPGI